jgi:hypothetical protein
MDLEMRYFTLLLNLQKRIPIMKMFWFQRKDIFMLMSIAQEHVLGRVVPESQLNNPKIRDKSILKDNLVKVH